MKLHQVRQGKDCATRRRQAILTSVLGAVVTLALLASCSERKEEVHKGDAGEVIIPSVQVKKQVLDRVDQLPGEIQAYQDVAIYPKIPGFIEWIGIDRGSIVKKDQPMVKMFAPEFLATRNEYTSKAEASTAALHEAESKLLAAKSTLLETKAKLAGDKDTFDRTKEASKVPGVVAPNEVVVLQDLVTSDEEKVHNVEENVAAAKKLVEALGKSEAAAKKAAENYKDIAAYLSITAPFDGYVTERNMHVGSFVGPRGKEAYPPIVRVQQLNLLRIVTPVPERDVGGIVPGAKVDFTVSTYPDKRFTGTVARLGNYLEQKTRTEPVELNYWNNDYTIKPGMFCEVLWPTRRETPSLFVPVSAVAVTTLDTFVDKIENGTVSWVKVKRGQLMGKWVEVFGDLKEGDVIALTGTDELRPGQSVKCSPAEHTTIESEKPERPPYHQHAMGSPVSGTGKISASDEDRQPR